MQAAVAFFAIRLVFGISLSALALLGREVVSAYFRILMLLSLGLAAFYCLSSARPMWGGLAICGCAFVGSVFWLLERRAAGAWSLALVALLAGTELCLSAGIPSERAALRLCSAVASAGTLGTAMCGMLLGHRYLTAPGMPLAPLLWINRLLFWATLVRAGLSVAALAQNAAIFGNSTYTVWLALRWLAGIAGSFAVWYMVRRILVYRNTQSATGVLFVGVILTFIGELTADLLSRATGIAY
ncbi:MAG: hypothetical protein ACT4QC_19800 [Planctomycetaceae bacterium]